MLFLFCLNFKKKSFYFRLFVCLFVFGGGGGRVCVLFTFFSPLGRDQYKSGILHIVYREIG